jgi:hypothetical protein
MVVVNCNQLSYLALLLQLVTQRLQICTTLGDIIIPIEITVMGQVYLLIIHVALCSMNRRQSRRIGT